MRNIEDQEYDLNQWAYRRSGEKPTKEVTLEDILKELQTQTSILKEILLSLKGQSNYDTTPYDGSRMFV